MYRSPSEMLQNTVLQTITQMDFVGFQ